MGVDGGIPGSSSEILALPVVDVLAAVPMDVPLGKTKIQEEDLVCGLVVAHAKVFWLYVAVEEVTIVDVLNSTQHLISQQEHGLEGEPSQCLFEKIL